MPDPRFHQSNGPFRLSELAAVAQAEIAGAPGDPDRLFSSVAPLDTAGPLDVSFLDNRKYLSQFEASKAGAVVVHPDLASKAPDGMVLLLTGKPYLGYARIAQAFYPIRRAAVPGVAPGASIDASASVDATAEIGHGAAIGPGAEIGPRTIVEPNVVIGRAVRIGADCLVGAASSISHAIIGDRVTIYPGARIGQDGFGFALNPPHGHVRVPQLGRVLIEDDVEIGANVTIDRGAGPDTIIRQGAMIDNLVQIGHNVEVGRGAVIVAQAGIAGSSKLGDFAVLAAKSGISGHISVGAGARIAAMSGVMRDVEPGADYAGTPALPKRQFFRQLATLARLSEGKGD